MFQKQRKIILELIPMVIELYNNRKINHKSFKEIWILDLLEMPKFNKYLTFKEDSIIRVSLNQYPIIIDSVLAPLFLLE